MRNEVITCRCGKKSVLKSNGETPGFRRICKIRDGLTFIYICNECYKKVRQLALQIVEITGTEYINFSGLLKE